MRNHLPWPTPTQQWHKGTAVQEHCPQPHNRGHCSTSRPHWHTHAQSAPSTHKSPQAHSLNLRQSATCLPGLCAQTGNQLKLLFVCGLTKLLPPCNWRRPVPCRTPTTNLPNLPGGPCPLPPGRVPSKQGISCSTLNLLLGRWGSPNRADKAPIWQQHLLHFGQQPHSRQQQPQDAVSGQARGAFCARDHPTAVKSPSESAERCLQQKHQQQQQPCRFCIFDRHTAQAGHLPPPAQTPRLCLHLCPLFN